MDETKGFPDIEYCNSSESTLWNMVSPLTPLLSFSNFLAYENSQWKVKVRSISGNPDSVLKARQGVLVLNENLCLGFIMRMNCAVMEFTKQKGENWWCVMLKDKAMNVNNG